MKIRKKNIKKEKLNIILSIIIIISSGLGLIIEFSKNYFLANPILYFTIQSNIIILIVTAIYLLKKNNTKLFAIIHFISTVDIMITGVIFCSFLIPDMAKCGSINQLATIPNITLHIVTPIASVLNYIFGQNYNLTFKDSLWGTFMPILFGIWSLILERIMPPQFHMFDGSESYFPYFFMDYHKNGIFTISGDIFKLGVFWWCLIIAIIIIILSNILIKLNKLHK